MSQDNIDDDAVARLKPSELLFMVQILARWLDYNERVKRQVQAVVKRMSGPSSPMGGNIMDPNSIVRMVMDEQARRKGLSPMPEQPTEPVLTEEEAKEAQNLLGRLKKQPTPST